MHAVHAAHYSITPAMNATAVHGRAAPMAPFSVKNRTSDLNQMLAAAQQKLPKNWVPIAVTVENTSAQVPMPCDAMIPEKMHVTDAERSTIPLATPAVNVVNMSVIQMNP